MMWQNRLLVGVACLVGLAGSAVTTALVVGQTELVETSPPVPSTRPGTTQATWDLSKLPKSTIDTLPDPTSPPETQGRAAETTELSPPVQTLTQPTVGTTAGTTATSVATTQAATTTQPPTTTTSTLLAPATSAVPATSVTGPPPTTTTTEPPVTTITEPPPTTTTSEASTTTETTT